MKTSPRYLFYFLLVGITSLLLTTYCTQLQNNYLIFSALLFALAIPDEAPTNIIAVAAAGIAITALLYLSALVTTNIFLAAIILSLLTFLLVNVGLQYRRYCHLLLLVNVFVLLAAAKSMPASDDHIIGVLGGAAIASICQMVFLFKRKQSEWRFFEKKAIQALQLVCADVFNCFLRKEYADNIYFFEHRIHKSKAAYFVLIQKLKQTALGQEPDHALILTKLQALFDILMDMAQLRHRTSDYSVFSLCEREMAGVEIELRKFFIALAAAVKKRKLAIDLYTLQRKIDLFADHYQGMLNVAAKEPLAFLLFIASLNHFREEAAWYA